MASCSYTFTLNAVSYYLRGVVDSAREMGDERRNQKTTHFLLFWSNCSVQTHSTPGYVQGSEEGL
jgi:hypothetical protein